MNKTELKQKVKVLFEEVTKVNVVLKDVTLLEADNYGVNLIANVGTFRLEASFQNIDLYSHGKHIATVKRPMSI